MASLNWLKVKDDLHEEPEVLEMARRLKTRPEHVVGYCIRFWGWVSRNCHDGTVTNVTLESLESVLTLPHFLSMMCDVGWLEYVESTSGTSIIIPNFDRHLSQSAKRRALEARRQAAYRVTQASQKRHADTVTREEKRREENITPKPPSGASAHFDQFWSIVPKKVAKATARKSYDRSVKRIRLEKPDLEDVHAYLRSRMAAYANSEVAKTEFCCNPSTWLNGGRWDDDDSAWTRSAPQEPEVRYEKL